MVLDWPILWAIAGPNSMTMKWNQQAGHNEICIGVTY